MPKTYTDHHDLESDLPAIANGIRNIYYFMIPLSGISFFVTLFMIKGHTLKRDDDIKLQEEGKQWVDKNKAKGIFHKRKQDAPIVTEDAIEPK